MATPRRERRKVGARGFVDRRKGQRRKSITDRRKGLEVPDEAASKKYRKPMVRITYGGYNPQPPSIMPDRRSGKERRSGRDRRIHERRK